MRYAYAMLLFRHAIADVYADIFFRHFRACIPTVRCQLLAGNTHASY